MSIATPPVDLETAYRACADIVRREAKNFSYGIRLLPGPKRRGMSAVYALARRLDDVGDGELPAAAKHDALDAARDSLAVIARDGTPPDPGDAVLAAVADAHHRFSLPMEAFDELIDGCVRDVDGARYQTFDELVGYCRLVAGSIGRLSLAIFGTDRSDLARDRADALGVALQITNILRDIVEDRDVHGRIYLPAADVARFGAARDLSGPPDAVAALVIFEAARARDWYDRGLELLPMLDRRSRACVGAMAGIYHELLERIERDPGAVLCARVSVPGTGKVLVATRALLGIGS
jgi:phytoene synthase